MQIDNTYYKNLKRNLEELPTFTVEFQLKDGTMISATDAEEFCLLWDDNEDVGALEWYISTPEGYWESHIVDTEAIAHIVESVDMMYTEV